MKKKKPNHLFKDDGYLGDRLKELNVLNKMRSAIVKDMKNIEKSHDQHHFSAEDISAILEALPIESLAQLCKFELSGQLDKPFLKIVKQKFKDRKEYAKKESELIGVMDKIRISSIDVVLAEIEALNKNMDKKK